MGSKKFKTISSYKVSPSVSLEVEIIGEGFPILCLHGHPGNKSCMSVFTDALSKKYKTITPDLRGYGNSKFEQEYLIEDHLMDLISLLDMLEIHRCLLLGWSLGGIIALELAYQQPERFTGIILVATAARPRSNHPQVNLWDLINTGIAGVLNWCNPSWQWNIEVFAKRSLFQYLLSQHNRFAYQRLAKEGIQAFFQTSRFAHSALNDALKTGYNSLDQLTSINCPCLILSGSDDRHITSDSSRETAEKIPNSQWKCYDNTAHLFPWEIPDLVLEDIESWLNTAHKL